MTRHTFDVADCTPYMRIASAEKTERHNTLIRGAQSPGSERMANRTPLTRLPSPHPLAFATTAWPLAWRESQPLAAPPVDSLLAQPSHEARLGHACTQIMAAVLARATLPRSSFIIPNDGCNENIDPDAVVEVPGLIEDGRWRGVPVGRLARPVAAMVQNEIAVQELAVRAAMEGSRSLALQALLIDPTVHSARAAEAFLDDALAAHREHLPAFWE